MVTKKIFVTLKSALVIVAAFLNAPSLVMADTYEVLAIKGVKVTAGSRYLKVGDRFTDKEKVNAIWEKPADKEGYVQFLNTSTNTVGIIVPSPGEGKKDEPSFWDRVKSYFSDIKKCSTRSDEFEEEEKVMADRLSQTFYLLDREDERITVATRFPLDEAHYFEATYHTPEDKQINKMRLSADNGVAFISPTEFRDIPRNGPRTIIRLSVDYVDTEKATRLPLTDGMNIILITP